MSGLELKRAAVMEDLSGYGRCALTIALPTLAVCGVEAVPIPTAVLSSHMGLPGVQVTDLTNTMVAAAQQYQTLNIPFDALYVGFLNGEAQLDEVTQVCKLLKREGTLLLVDPVMGDNGHLYRSVTPNMAKGLRDLCAQADVITPNLTEAAALLNLPPNALNTQAEAAHAAEQLCDLGAQTVVLTGVVCDDRICTVIARQNAVPQFITAPYVAGAFHGTGDLFASVLLGTRLNGDSMESAVQKAVDFVSVCVRRTALSGCASIGGLHFEPELYRLFSSASINR